MAKPKRPKHYKTTKYDWVAIEARYVTGNMSLSALAEEVGCGETTIFRLSKREDWIGKRREHASRIAGIAQENKERTAILDKIQFDALSENGADLAAAVVVEKFTREYTEAKAGNRTPIEALELKEFLSSLKLAQEIKYRSLNIAPPKQSLAIEHVKSPAESLADTLQEAIREYEEISAGLPDDVTEPEEVHYEHGGNGKQNGKPRVI